MGPKGENYELMALLGELGNIDFFCENTFILYGPTKFGQKKFHCWGRRVAYGQNLEIFCDCMLVKNSHNLIEKLYGIN